MTASFQSGAVALIAFHLQMFNQQYNVNTLTKDEACSFLYPISVNGYTKHIVLDVLRVSTERANSFISNLF